MTKVRAPFIYGLNVALTMFAWYNRYHWGRQALEDPADPELRYVQPYQYTPHPTSSITFLATS